ncbi:MAG: hypothetical protein GTN80_01410 [Nitrososphaeria archaeon]|nr:hypothetical protein [Nitrososphaeria archaeon]NIQ32300.1 hypothetical protein [Nitrososphaeria archaeon]
MDLEQYLKEKEIKYRFIEKPQTIHTHDAARLSGLELQRVTKNLVARTDSRNYVLLIIPGDRRVNLGKVRSLLKVENVSLASFNEAEGISGYPPGGTPSIGHKTKMTTVMDRSLLNLGKVYCGGGSRHRLLELRVEDIIRLSKPIIADILD